MKKYKKTYAILNLAEKHTTFHLGKTRVYVSFTGGQVTKKGVTPATFTTADPIVQLAIEKSKAFRDGAVTLLAQYPMQGEVKIGMNPPEEEESTAPNPEPCKAELIRNAGFSAQKPATAEISEEKPEPTPKVQPEEAAPEEPTAETPVAMAAEDAQPKQEAAKNDGLEVVEVSCKDTAKAYLQDHFGENPAPLRTRDDVQNCAAKYGITFNFV